jgi:hypothetical protein
LVAAGCPDAVFFLSSNNEGEGECDPLSRQNLKKLTEKAISAQGGIPTYRLLDPSSPALVCRTLCELKLNALNWRASRSYMLTESVIISEEKKEENSLLEIASGNCSILVSGFIRGKPLSVNSLIHVLGVGVGKVVEISSASGEETIIADESL